MFSGGMGSYASAKWVKDNHGSDDLYLLFCDVKGEQDNPHIGEDEDTYRFIEAAAKFLGGHYIYLNVGKTIWDIFEEKRFLGNSRYAPCTRLLKQKPARDWIDQNCKPEETIIYVGIDWSEIHRLPKIVENYKPWTVKAPLTEPPYSDKYQWIAQAKADGLPIPRLYELGFAHNNCGGGCVKAGQAQFKKLYEIMPERFKVWEEREEQVRQKLGKDVSILNSRIGGGKRKPLPLSVLRKQIEENSDQIDLFDEGGCGCFLDFETGEE